MPSKNRGSGGFEKMDLPLNIIKGIRRKGYAQPTPIQRKTIPPILEGRDVVAMARTGSGKTAAFLIPIFRHLMSHSILGIRAIVFSPTRELALQTAKFIKELSKFLDLKFALILGGDSMEEQFAAIHSCPDIIVTTPGRFLHLVVEMSLKLSSVTHVVFDEADRLFELGFAEQINEIIKRLPNQKQTLLFSATMPGLVADFAKVRLKNPLIIRLDVEHKLSENLELINIHVREEEKLPLLLYLLDRLVSSQLLTVIFVPTKHHVEYYREVLENNSVTCSFLYSSLDHTARKINAAKFYNRKTSVMIVTDIAARGIDIPILDAVININFPATPKLFVHRVGRVARAGRCGKAYSFISNPELPYLIDLTLFLSYSIHVCKPGTTTTNVNVCNIGSVPPNMLINECNQVAHLHNTCSTTESLHKASLSAYIKYASSRSLPSGESVSRAKSLISELHAAPHTLFVSHFSQNELMHNDFLKELKAFKPPCTIFEINPIKSRRKAVEVMRAKRGAHDNMIRYKRLHQEPNLRADPFEKARLTNKQFIDYYPKNSYSEKGLSVTTDNNIISNDIILNMDGDENESLHRRVPKKNWDRKRKKFVQFGVTQNVKKMKTESGSMIRASYKTNIYDNWLKKKKKADSKKKTKQNIDNIHIGLESNNEDTSTTANKRRNMKYNKSNSINNRSKRSTNNIKHVKKNRLDKSKFLNRKNRTPRSNKKH